MTDLLKLQKIFIQQVIQKNIPVSIYLINGVQLKGHIEQQDDETLILNNDLAKLIYKHAISTIVPTQSVEL